MSVKETDQKELFNQDVKHGVDSALYLTTLLEQWKTANELTAHISSQRNNINSFYISLLSLLIGGVLLSDQLMVEHPLARTIILILILIVGNTCCVTWVKQVDKCKRINYQKYQIIEQLEARLPANVLSYESSIPTTQKKTAVDKALSDYEKSLAIVFGTAITLIVITMLVEVWWVVP
jgi:hypothetical protein